MALQFSEQFMQHYLVKLSPLAWKLYLHLLFICSQRNKWQLQANELELEPVNQFVNKKQYAAELKSAVTELQQQELLKADYAKQCLWLISPELKQKLWDLAALWQRELASMSNEQKQQLSLSNFVLAQVDGCTVHNQKLLDYLLATSTGENFADREFATNAFVANEESSLPSANELGQAVTSGEQELVLPAEQATTQSQAQTASKQQATEYNELVQAINKRFLAGISSYSWINLIDQLHNAYRFENSLIYAMFATLQSEGHLYKDRLQHLANDLDRANVRTASGFEQWLGQKELVEQRRPFVQAALQRYNLTTADLEIVNKWFDEYAYDEEIIKYLFSKSVESTNPTLTWFDAIISRWYKAGYKTLAEIQAAEAAFKTARPKKQFAVRSGLANYKPRSQKESYTERHYDADFYKKLMQGSKHKLQYD